MKIWFDADNAPHVLVMKPLAEELTRRGHTVLFTARDRSSTCELLDMYNLDYIKVGGTYRNSTVGKITGTIRRAFALRKAMKHWKADVSFGHGSRALPIASRMLRVPSITMYDYEWVNPSLFNRFCSKILLPDVITLERCREAGIDTDKVRFFPGFKENLYLNDVKPDPSIDSELGLKDEKIKVLLRPPATTAHYHNPEAEEILDALLEKLFNDPEVQLIWIPRTPDQNELIRGSHKAEIIIPAKVYPGPQLILAMDMIIGGGGTMTREAAVLGVPSITFFKGKRGAVDDALHNSERLQILPNKEEASTLHFRRTRLPVCSAEDSTINNVVDYILN
ncbi:MAG: DUF354 domain-containing protein [Candidatus Aegiribacteria sp.]|nr:DUF354 domain-containing protein [Candidatus Aegiribacteria sp.]